MDNLTFSQINVRKTEDGLYSVFDAIQFIAQKGNQRKVWKRLCESHPEVAANVTTYKFPGAGQRDTPVANKITIIEIISLLPGEVGGQTRKAASARVLDDSESLDIESWDCNAESKVVDLTGIAIHSHTHGAFVYLSDLIRIGYTIKPERLMRNLKPIKPVDKLLEGVYE